MNVVDLLLRSSSSGRPAVLGAQASLSHSVLCSQVYRFAAGLLSQSFGKGDRIALWSENNSFFVIAYLAVMKAGLVVVPIQTDSTQESFARLVNEAGIRLVLVSQRYAAKLSSWAKELGIGFFAESQLATLPELQEVGTPGLGRPGEDSGRIHDARTPEAGRPYRRTDWPVGTTRADSAGAQVFPGPESGRFPEIDPDKDLAALMFTSGSTGKPKGVMVTHRNIEVNTRDIVEYMHLTPADRVMVVLPFHYCFGLSLLHSHLMAGATLVLNNQFMYPEKVLEDMIAKECTGIAGVPSTYQILLRKSRCKEMKFPALRWFQQAGGKLPNPYIQEIRQSFPEVEYYLMYGQTEATARLSYLPPERLADKLGSIGQGLPSTRLEVLKPDGNPVGPGSDEVGEIVASGGNITLGYWNDPEETAKFFKNGRLHTGDLARVDADGFIYVVERDREMIKSGGNRVSAKEVEDVIAELAEVVEVAVIGVPHELLGEAIRAFVALAPDARITDDQIIEHCRRRLPVFKTPESVTRLPVLPHNSSGKVLKPKLKELTSTPG